MVASCPSCCPPTGAEGWINSSYDGISHCRVVGARLQLLQVKELPPGGAWSASPLITSVLKEPRHLFWCWEGTDRCLSCDQRVGCLRKVRSVQQSWGEGHSNWCLHAARVVMVSGFLWRRSLCQCEILNHNYSAIRYFVPIDTNGCKYSKSFISIFT